MRRSRRTCCPTRTCPPPPTPCYRGAVRGARLCGSRPFKCNIVCVRVWLEILSYVIFDGV